MDDLSAFESPALGGLGAEGRLFGPVTVVFTAGHNLLTSPAGPNGVAAAVGSGLDETFFQSSAHADPDAHLPLLPCQFPENPPLKITRMRKCTFSHPGITRRLGADWANVGKRAVNSAASACDLPSIGEGPGQADWPPSCPPARPAAEAAPRTPALVRADWRVAVR